MVVWSNEAVTLDTSKSRGASSQLLKEEPLYTAYHISPLHCISHITIHCISDSWVNPGAVAAFSVSQSYCFQSWLVSKVLCNVISTLSGIVSLVLIGLLYMLRGFHVKYINKSNHMIIFFSFTGDTLEDDITPTSPEEYYLEGSRVKISCNYTVRSDSLLWYRQYPGLGVQFLYIVYNPYKVRGDPQDIRLSVNLN